MISRGSCNILHYRMEGANIDGGERGRGGQQRPPLWRRRRWRGEGQGLAATATIVEATRMDWKGAGQPITIGTCWKMFGEAQLTYQQMWLIHHLSCVKQLQWREERNERRKQSILTPDSCWFLTVDLPPFTNCIHDLTPDLTTLAHLNCCHRPIYYFFWEPLTNLGSMSKSKSFQTKKSTKAEHLLLHWGKMAWDWLTTLETKLAPILYKNHNETP